MRKIDRVPPNTSEWKRWIQDCQKETEQVMVQAAGGERPSIGSLYRRKSIRQEYFFSKGSPFFGTCAYCETPITDYQHGDLDHFRPKAGVTHENDEVVHLLDPRGEISRDDQGKPIPHPGYYWLAYDWENLLPSCIRCNQPSTLRGRKVGKHNRFPVSGRHAQTPGEVDREEPLLIDPGSQEQDDDPSRHLNVDTETGLMVERSDRGAMCIEIFALNRRDQLLADRKRACDQVWQLLSRILRPGGDAGAIRELQEIRAGRHSFTMAQLAVLEEAREGLAPALDPQI